MPELILRLQTDPVTGRKNVIISYRSDSDALPMEHEQEHRNLVDRLIEGGALKAGELGKIIVERVAPEAEKAAVEAEQGQSERRSVEQKNG